MTGSWNGSSRGYSTLPNGMPHKAAARRPDSEKATLKPIPHPPLHTNRLLPWHGHSTTGWDYGLSPASLCLHQWSTVTQTNGEHLPPTMHFCKSHPGKNINVLSSLKHSLLKCDFPQACLWCRCVSPVCNLNAGEEPRCISPATRVMNCRAPRASAASEWQTAT